MNLGMVFVSMMLAPGVLAQEAAMYRVGPDHLGRVEGPGRLPKGLAWSFATKGKVRSTPAAAGGMAFFGSDDGRFRAVDLEKGREAWGLDVGGPIPCSPAIAQGLVVFQGRDNVARALDLRTGRTVWTFAGGADLPPRPGDDVGWDFWVSSPCVEGGSVYFGSGSGQVFALDLKSGKRRWAFPTAQRVRSSPAVKDGTVYVGGFDGQVYALDAATGEKRWAFDTGGGIQSSPAVWEGTVFVGSRSASVFALDARTGALRWRRPHPNGSWVLTSPAVAGGKVIVGSSDEQFLQALDAGTGEEVWRVSLRYRVLGSPVVAGGFVYVGTEGAYTYVLDLETGLVAGGLFGAEGPVNGSLALAGGRILVPSDDNTLYAFASEPAAAEAPADPGLLQPFVGRYQLGRSAVTLSLRNGRLAFERGGFPAELCRVGPAGELRVPASGLTGTLGRNAQGEPRIAFRVGEREIVAARIP
ncbi:MAG TPA: PQQ-binding-like beta-propeller repeat protein [Holophaga sp.]|nr:PQQ-binding-like beta-propeller repeat protein [Holophaga sp.]